MSEANPSDDLNDLDNANRDADNLSQTKGELQQSAIVDRFRGYLPVVLDIETGGFNAATDAMLEIAATMIRMSDTGQLYCGDTYNYHVAPFEGANIDPAALEFTGIKPFHPLRPSQDEKAVLQDLFGHIRAEVKRTQCKRAIVVAHNAAFDQAFLNAAIERCAIKRSPFHPFSSFDTASLAGLALGQTVLAKACYYAGIEFDNKSAHNARYDCEKTADLFCHMVNRWQSLGGWPPPEPNRDAAEPA